MCMLDLETFCSVSLLLLLADTEQGCQAPESVTREQPGVGISWPESGTG